MKEYAPVSICMAYYNRLGLLRNTLQSIVDKPILPTEIVIVDDASSELLTLDNISGITCLTKINIIIHNFNSTEKTWINPVVAFNKSVELSTNDVIIIQNPECYHKTNVVSTLTKLKEFEYISMSCYSLSDKITPDSNIIYDNRSASFDGDNAWYNHSIYRPKHYHFCAMLNKIDFYNIGGFDVRLQNGIGYDDDMLIYRLNKNNVRLIIDDSQIVYHQYHTVSNNQNQELINTNRNIYYSTMEEHGI